MLRVHTTSQRFNSNICRAAQPPQGYVHRRFRWPLAAQGPEGPAVARHHCWHHFFWIQVCRPEAWNVHKRCTDGTMDSAYRSGEQGTDGTMPFRTGVCVASSVAVRQTLSPNKQASNWACRQLSAQPMPMHAPSPCSDCWHHLSGACGRCGDCCGCDSAT